VEAVVHILQSEDMLSGLALIFREGWASDKTGSYEERRN
jgi:hypothetical protein